jgi:hypothetical protein
MSWILPIATLSLCVSLVDARLSAQQEPAAAAAAPATARAQGLKVTYAPFDAERRKKEGSHSFRARVASLAVERGETPTPLIAPGAFEAKFEGVLPLAVRDRYRFRVEGRGSFTLTINGEKPAGHDEAGQKILSSATLVIEIRRACAGDPAATVPPTAEPPVSEIVEYTFVVDPEVKQSI